MKVDHFIAGYRKQFEHYKLLGEKTFEQLSNEQLFSKCSAESNNIPTIVKHLSGNMMSRWTDFLVADGEKTWRNREYEFVDDIVDRTELISTWNRGWCCLFSALNSINEHNFNQPVYIRNEEHSVIEALNRQLAHYAYHIGQIVCIGKLKVGSLWISLSITPGDSEAFNQEKFSKPKQEEAQSEEYSERYPTEGN
jgi:hypothetical protein